MTHPYPLSMAGNPSKTDATTPKQWFPPLDHCNTSPGCIGHYEAIYNALNDLIARLPALSSVAQSSVLDKIGVDANGKKLTTQSFIQYLTSVQPRFYDGSTSTYCYDSLTEGSYCFKWAFFKFLLNDQDVQEVFADPNVLTITGTPSYPMLSFFQPTTILFASLGENLGNEARIFHEALHGISGQYDFETLLRPTPQLLERLGYTSNDPSCMIDTYIQNTVLSQSAGLDQAKSSCP